MKRILVLFILALSPALLADMVANETSKIIVTVVNEKYLPPARKAAEEAAKKILRIQKKKKLSARDQSKIEELKKIIEIYKFWSDYSKALTTLNSTVDTVTRSFMLKAIKKKHPVKYKKLTEKDFPINYRKIYSAVYKKEQKVFEKLDKEKRAQGE